MARAAAPASDYDGLVTARLISWLGAAALAGTFGCSFPAQGAGGDGADLDDTTDNDDPPPRFDADPAAPDANPAAPDANRPPDATPPFDPATNCPASYATAIFAGGSRYRYMDPSPLEYRTFEAAVQECASDAPGLTHLAVPDVEGEADLWMDIIDSDTYQSRYTWIGVYREADSADWFGVTGDAISPSTLNITDEFEFVIRQANAALYLRPANNAVHDNYLGALYHAVCECDGKPSVY